MNFQQLEYILAVHHHKHFGKAADSCNITQATLSAMIKKLEEELSTDIFDRSRHPIITTEAGLSILDIATKIVSLKKELEQIKEEPLSGLSGKLRIGIIPTIANSLLPLLLPPLLKENPDLELIINEITTEEIKQRLEMNDIDFGILATPLGDELLDETILYYEPMMVYGIKDSSKTYITSKDISDRKIWLLEEGHCFRNQAMTICEIKEKENSASNLHFEGSSFDTLLNMTDKFGGFTLVPELFYKEMDPRRKPNTKPFQTPIPVREVSLVTYRPLAKKRTIEFLGNRIREIITPHLSTSKYENKDLDIIGI